MTTHDVRLRNGALFEFSFISLLHLQADGMQSMLSMSKVSLPLLLLHHFLDIVKQLARSTTSIPDGARHLVFGREPRYNFSVRSLTII
jgi:hypothetical protein